MYLLRASDAKIERLTTKIDENMVESKFVRNCTRKNAEIEIDVEAKASSQKRKCNQFLTRYVEELKNINLHTGNNFEI